MAITSRSNRVIHRARSNTQLRYAVIYMTITFVVLLFLNIYCSETSQQIFYRSKEVSMIEKCQLAASEISNLEVINAENVSRVISEMEGLRLTRLIITDQHGLSIYDSWQETGNYILFPEVVEALRNNDVFTWYYHDGIMHSQAAVPLLNYGRLTGCVYMMELDTQEGELIRTLQTNILTVTLVLELVVIIFSLFFSRAFSSRMRRIMASMRIIQEGDYTHKVALGGYDELSILGTEINDLTDRLQSSEEKRRQFVSDASHELKTPLASIKLLTDSILQNAMDQDTMMEFVSDIGKEADRLNRMSQKLLSLSKADSQVESEAEIILMTPTARRVVRMLTGIARRNRIRIQTDYTGDCPVLIQEDDLYQIIFNLVENGIKYNTPGGSLHLSLHRDENTAMLKVTDTGVGIPPESIGQIFERFYRVDKARSRKSGGSGLGLAIVRGIVERNNGTIMVESAVGQGTTFTVYFPAYDMKEPEETEEIDQ